MLRKFLYQSLGLVLKLLLLVVPAVWAIALVFGSPSAIKHAVEGSGIYDNYVDIALDDSRKNTSDKTTQQLLADPEIEKAVKESFGPDFLSTSVSSVIDGVFAWLDGKTDKVMFTIDATASRDKLRDKLQAYGEAKAAALPLCTLADLPKIANSTDLLNFPCRPPFLSAAQIGKQFRDEAVQSVELLNNPVITEQTIAAKNSDKALGEGYERIPAWYQRLQLSKWVLLGLALVVAALLIFARKNRRAGVRHVAWALLTAGLFYAVALIAYVIFMSKAPAVNSDLVGTTIMNGLNILIDDLRAVTTYFTIGYIAAGAIMLLALKRLVNPTPEPTQPQPDALPADQTDLVE